MKSLAEFKKRLAGARSNRRLRQAPSPFSIALSESIGQLREGDWDALVGSERLFLGRPYLAALESAPPEGMGFRYALLYEGPRPVAAFYVQVLSLGGAQLGAREGEERKLRDHLRARVLVGGNALLTGEHAFALAQGVDPAAAYHGLADVLYRLRRAEKLRGQVSAVLVKDFFPASAEGARELRRFGYRAFQVDPQMVIPLRASWKTLEDYLKDFSAKYRGRARGVLKKAQALEWRDLSASDLAAARERIADLYLAVHRRAKLRLYTPHPDYFQRLKEALGAAFEFTGVYHGQDLVGFTCSFYTAQAMELHAVGLDYERNQELAVYQAILYDAVRRGIARGLPRISMGRTAADMKSAVGAEPQEAVCYLRHRGPVSNRVLRPLLGFLKPTPWTERHPFK